MAVFAHLGDGGREGDGPVTVGAAWFACGFADSLHCWSGLVRKRAVAVVLCVGNNGLNQSEGGASLYVSHAPHLVTGVGLDAKVLAPRVH